MKLNIKYLYAFRSIGKGTETGTSLSAMMNLAPPNTRLQNYYNTILPALTDVCEASMRNAVIKAIEINDNHKDISADFDYTW